MEFVKLLSPFCFGCVDIHRSVSVVQFSCYNLERWCLATKIGGPRSNYLLDGTGQDYKEFNQ